MARNSTKTAVGRALAFEQALLAAVANCFALCIGLPCALAANPVSPTAILALGDAQHQSFYAAMESWAVALEQSDHAGLRDAVFLHLTERALAAPLMGSAHETDKIVR